MQFFVRLAPRFLSPVGTQTGASWGLRFRLLHYSCLSLCITCSAVRGLGNTGQNQCGPNVGPATHLGLLCLCGGLRLPLCTNYILHEPGPLRGPWLPFPQRPGNLRGQRHRKRRGLINCGGDEKLRKWHSWRPVGRLQGPKAPGWG